MKMNFTRVLVAAAIIAGGAALAACSGNPAVPAVGSDLNADFYKSFAPYYAKGTKRTYTLTTKINGTAAPSTEMIQEVLDVVGDQATIKTTINGTTAAESKMSITGNPLDAGGSSSPYKSEGAEDVKVPAGEFKGAAKISVTSGSTKSIAWLSAGTGLVKSETTSGTSVSLIELKEYKK